MYRDHQNLAIFYSTKREMYKLCKFINERIEQEGHFAMVKSKCSERQRASELKLREGQKYAEDSTWKSPFEERSKQFSKTSFFMDILGKSKEHVSLIFILICLQV